MNCTSYTLNGLNNQCKDSLGGIAEVYIGLYDRLSEVLVNNNIATPVLHRLADQNKLFKFEIPKNNGSLTSTLNTSENVSAYYTNSISMTFYKMETSKRLEMMALLGQDVFVLAKDKNGKIWFLGKEEPVQVTEASATTGTAKADANSYSITLTDESSELPFEVLPETLDALLTNWQYEYLTFEVINDDTYIKLKSTDLVFNTEIQISLDKEDWETIESMDNMPFNDILNNGDSFDAGTKVYIRGNGDPFADESEHSYFDANSPIYVYGNIHSLYSPNGFDDPEGEFGLEDSDPARLFESMFYIPEEISTTDRANILSHPNKELIIPYTSIETSEALFGMFQGCSALEYAPTMYMTELVDVNSQCNLMFEGCTSLKYIKADFALLSDVNNHKTYIWLQNASSTGTFVTSNISNLSLSSRNVSNVPAGWTIKYMQN